MTREPWARATARLRTSAALGLLPATAPVMVLVPLGMLLGRAGGGFIGEDALARLDAVTSIALATLGVFIGAAAGSKHDGGRRLAIASSMEALITIASVSAAIYVLLEIWNVPIPLPYALAATALGICASASAAPPVAPGHEGARAIAARVADLDDVVPIVLGGLVIATAGSLGSHPGWGVAATALVGLAVGGTGWLLFDASQGAERNVYVLGSLAVLGGCAAYLDGSPLLAGMAAGWLWALTPGDADRIVRAQLAKVQHPLVVLLLVIAGASLEVTLAGVWLLAPYVVFRLAGKLIGGYVASRIASGIAPADLGAYLVRPGVIGIAFSLNLAQVAPEGAGALVFAVSIGAVASELLTLFVIPVPHSA